MLFVGKNQNKAYRASINNKHKAVTYELLSAPQTLWDSVSEETTNEDMASRQLYLNMRSIFREHSKEWVCNMKDSKEIRKMAKGQDNKSIKTDNGEESF